MWRWFVRAVSSLYWIIRQKWFLLPVFWVCDLVALTLYCKLMKVFCIYPDPDRSGAGYCFRLISLFVSLFLCFFVSKIARKWLDRFAWNFQGRCGVTMGRPDYIFWSIPRNRAMPRCATRGRGLLCFRTTACYVYFNIFPTLQVHDIKVRPVERRPKR